MSDTKKPVIFIACADGVEEESRLKNLQLERDRIERLFTILQNGGLCKVISEGHTSKDRFYHNLRHADHKDWIQIIHFAGHADDSFLRFISPDGEEEAKSVERLCEDLKGLKSLKLVFLNGCATKNFVEGLLNIGIPAVLATSRKIKDSEALEFATKFYDGIIVGKQSIEDAFTQAKRLLIDDKAFDSELIGIKAVRRVEGKMSLLDDEVFRASKSAKKRLDAAKQDTKEFVWNLYHRGEDAVDGNEMSKQSILKWIFYSELKLNPIEDDNLKNQLENYKKEIELLRAQEVAKENNRKKQELLQTEMLKKKDELDRKTQEFEETKRLAEEELAKVKAKDGIAKWLKEKKGVDAFLEEEKKLTQKLQDEIDILDKEIKDISKGANKELLEQGLLLLNFTKQKDIYDELAGLTPKKINLVLVKGNQETEDIEEEDRAYEIDILIKVILREWALISKVAKKIVIDFSSKIGEKPTSQNIWSLVHKALFKVHGANTKVISNADTDQLIIDVCDKLNSLLETDPVIIKWDRVMEEMTSDELIPIVNTFWEKVAERFTNKPPKNHLFLFMVDHMGMGNQLIDPKRILKAQINDSHFFYPLPPIGPVGYEDIKAWALELKKLLARHPNLLPDALMKIEQEHKYFIEKDSPPLPIVEVVPNICQAFGYKELADTIIK